MEKQKSGKSDNVLIGKKSGQLHRPTRAVTKNDFSTSFTNKVKSNNNSLAKSLAKAKATIDQQADEIKLHKANYNEIMMKKYAVEVRHKECIGKLESYVTRSLHEVKGVLDTLISIKEELISTKLELNGNPTSFCYDLHQQRVTGLPQTQSVGPMVQGHSIRQPRISLSRINPRSPNGARVPAVPVPAVPALADGVQIAAAGGVVAIAAVASTSASASAEESDLTVLPPLETIDMFYARARNEDPKEGPSSGKRGRPFKQQRVIYQESTDDDSDEYDEPLNLLSNRTSYSPIIMDETATHSRLSTISQEESPNSVVAEIYSSVPFLSQTTQRKTAKSESDAPGNGASLPQISIEYTSMRPNKSRGKCELPQVESGSPSRPLFHGFNENANESANRSAEELRSPPWSSLGKKNFATDENIAQSETCAEPGVKRLKTTPKKREGLPLKVAAARGGLAERSCPSGAFEDPTQRSGAEKPLLFGRNPREPSSQSEPRIPNKYATKKDASSDPTPAGLPEREPTAKKEVRSDPLPGGRSKRKRVDPDWTPGEGAASPDVGAGKRAVAKRRAAVAASQHWVDAESPVSSRGPRVVVDKLDLATIAAATGRPRTGSLDGLTANREEVLVLSGRSSKRSKGPTNYKEPRLNVKLRRN